MKITELVILVAEDDEDDRMLMEEALEENLANVCLRFVTNGEELLNYLHGRQEYDDRVRSPRPHLILLDLNMPIKDGREALSEIKTNDRLKQIPVVVLTTSKTQEDVYRSYYIGVNSFITKPVNFEGLVEVIKVLRDYWFEIVELPEKI